MTQIDETRRNEGLALVAQGREALLAGDQAQADALLAQATALFTAIGDDYTIAAQTGNYGWALRRVGYTHTARPYLQRAAELFTAMGLADFAERHRSAAEDAEPPLLAPDLLATLPPAVRGALERGDGQGLQFAIDALPIAQQQIIFDQLVQAGVIRDANDEDLDLVVTQFAPLLNDIAAVARGDNASRAEIEAFLPELESKGWSLRAPIYAIWAGTRDRTALTANLDPADSALIKHVLDLLAQGEGEEAV